MLHLRLQTAKSDSESSWRRLEEIEGVRRMLRAEAPGSDLVVLSADVEPGAADRLLAVLDDLRVEPDAYVLTRLDVVAPIPARRLPMAVRSGFAWLEVLGEARQNSRPLARYLALMSVAGLIAAMGVIESNSVLIVGAMAVSPDILPVCSVCVGVVGKRWKLAGTAGLTLLVGLLLVATVAALATFLLLQTGLVDDGFDVADSSISTLAADTDYSTVLVALAAGIAAMLAFETRASAAVGVAISVTTIPASAYLGVAFGSGNAADGLGALLVLSLNVVLLIVSGSATLWLQHAFALRAGPGP